MSPQNSEAASLAERVRIGTMGWGYDDWRGPFYPEGSASRDYITLYARAFDAVEIDSTFYGTPRESQVKHWAKVTPDGFLFCPKAPRLLTHEMRLSGAQEELKRFVEVMGLLGPKRGPMLLQLPPDFTRDEIENVQAFLPQLAALGDTAARFAIEFRHRSLLGPDVTQMLAAHNVALVAADFAAMPKRFTLTADFAYLRLIGRHGAYPEHRQRQGDRAADMQRWAEALRENAARVSPAFVFCNNDYEGYAPDTANRLKTMLGLPSVARPPETQGSLF